MADNNVNKWYVVRAVSGQEKKLKLTLKQKHLV